MNWYLVQITDKDVDDLDAIDVSKFQRFEAENSQEAAIKPLRKAGAIKTLVDAGHTVVFSYVGKNQPSLGAEKSLVSAGCDQ